MKEEKENREQIPNKEEAQEVGKFIRISAEADEALSSLHESLNKSGDTVRVTKVMVASYVLEKFCQNFGEEDAKTLYLKNVSEVDLLKLAYKRALDSGAIPDNLREILFANAGLTPSFKKAKKPRQGHGSIATMDDMEAS